MISVLHILHWFPEHRRCNFFFYRLHLPPSTVVSIIRLLLCFLNSGMVAVLHVIHWRVCQRRCNFFLHGFH